MNDNQWTSKSTAASDRRGNGGERVASFQEAANMSTLVRDHDWSATPLGPPDAWPQALQTLVGVLLSSSQPMFLVWGPQRTTIYNDGYREILAGKHPALGKPFDEIWEEIWQSDLEPIVARAYAGEALHMTDIPLVMGRKGYAEETHFAFSYTPVRDESGAVQGFFCPCLEITEQVLEQRRARVRAELTERLRNALDPDTLGYEGAALLGRHLGAFEAAYLEIDESGEHAVVTRSWQAEEGMSSVGRHRLEDFGPAFIADLRASRSVAIGDVHEDERTATPEALANFASRGIRAFLDVPFLREGRLAAVMAVHAHEPRRWHPADVALAEELAQRVHAAVERVRAEAALRASEERMRLAMRATGMVTWEWLPAQDMMTTSDGFAALFGLPASARAEEGYALILPTDEEAHTEGVRKLAAEGGSYAAEFSIRRPDDGRIVWLEERGEAQLDADGRVERVIGVVFDVTERKCAEAALRESEARFREFGEASSDALWIRRADTLEWEYLSAAFDTIYGVDRERAVASRSVDTLLDLIVPEDRERTLQAIVRLREAEEEEGDYEYRIRRPSDGQIRCLRSTGFRLRDADGRVRRLGGITRDVTRERQTADRMDVLLAELQHRTRNLIGVIRAIARRTQRASASLEAFGEQFGARLDALARANALLSRLKDGERVAFEELLHAELRGHGIAVAPGGEGRIALHGPPGIRLKSASVQTLALALHELLTNATKHGALRRPEGRLAIAWHVVHEAGEPRLRVDWRESWAGQGEAEHEAALGSGYGRELIERAIPYQLGAQTRYDLRPDGLNCIVVMPLSASTGTP